MFHPKYVDFFPPVTIGIILLILLMHVRICVGRFMEKNDTLPLGCHPNVPIEQYLARAAFDVRRDLRSIHVLKTFYLRGRNVFLR